jgi:hypothetical protein
VDPALDHFARLGQDAELAFLLVHVDANMFHGWPPLLRHRPRSLSVGPSCHHVERVASRFIPSTIQTGAAVSLSQRAASGREIRSIGKRNADLDQLPWTLSRCGERTSTHIIQIRRGPQ